MSDLSGRVLKLTMWYIGPASAKFLERQTMAHMHGLKFQDLAKEHIPELAKWVNISAGLLIDKAKADDLSKKIRTLA